MLTTPSGLTDAHRTVFYRLVVLDAALQHRSADVLGYAMPRNTSPGSSPHSDL